MCDICSSNDFKKRLEYKNSEAYDNDVLFSYWMFIYIDIVYYIHLGDKNDCANC